MTKEEKKKAKLRKRLRKQRNSRLRELYLDIKRGTLDAINLSTERYVVIKIKFGYHFLAWLVARKLEATGVYHCIIDDWVDIDNTYHLAIDW